MNEGTFKTDLLQTVKDKLPEAVITVSTVGMTPVKNGAIQRAVEWGTELGAEIVKVLSDKKVTFLEGIGFTDNGVELIPIIRDFRTIGDDWDYLKENDEYLEAILSGVEVKLAITSEHTRGIVKQSIVVGVEAGKLIEMIAEAKGIKPQD